MMEDYSKKKSTAEAMDKEIVFSQSVKAGKRIYYIDVKRNRKDELFLAITESKKTTSGEGSEAKFSIEKHKIFIYHEDFDKFLAGLDAAVGYIKANQPAQQAVPAADTDTAASTTSATDADADTDGGLGGDIKIDIEF